MDVELTSGFGQLGVIATTNRGLSADELADLALSKIITISADAPEPVRLQAEAFREQIRKVLVYYIRQGKRSGLTDLYNVLRDSGQHDAAAIVLKINQGA